MSADAGASAAAETANPTVSVGRVLSEWAAAPLTNDRIGDWRRAGYRRGVWPPVEPKRVVSAAERGIVPGDAEVSGALQELLDELETDGGVLELNAGRYILDNPLLVHGSHVVIRGRGSDRTTLYFSRTLEESLGAAPLNGSSGWSWNGGNVFFISRERFRSSTQASWAGVRPNREGWLTGDILGSIRPAERGSYQLEVDGIVGLRAGDLILVEVDDDENHALLRSMAGDIPGAESYNWDTRAATIAGPERFGDFDAWQWPVRVMAVDGVNVRLEQPLKLPIRTAARIRALLPSVHDSGVEGVTIENHLRVQTSHNVNPGSNGVGFQAVSDCWARDVHVVNADVAFALTAAKSCQLSGVSAGGRSLHHFVACRVQSHDNLIEDFRLDDFTVPAVQGSYLHGLNVEGYSSGNVYRRGVMHTGTFDSHRQLPFENLRTAITLTNKDAVPGGALDGGPYFGARTVNWGINVTNGNNLCVDITDMAPSSLTAGITGLKVRGSILPRVGLDFEEPLGSDAIDFGEDLGPLRDLLEVQRDIAPII